MFLPETKEIHFFDEKYDLGTDWYYDHFSDAPEGLVRGEITPNYLDQSDAAARIAKTLPDVRLFVILREPVSRARSSFELLRHRFPGQSFQQACESGSYLVDLGLYAKHLQRFYDHFEPSRIHVILYEDLTSSAETTLFKLYDFLEVPRRPVDASVSRSTNSVLFPRTQVFLKRIGAGGLVQYAKHGGVGDALRYVGGKAKRFRVRKEDDRELRRLFKEDIEKLQCLISRDLSHWL